MRAAAGASLQASMAMKLEELGLCSHGSTCWDWLPQWKLLRALEASQNEANTILLPLQLVYYYYMLMPQSFEALLPPWWCSYGLPQMTHCGPWCRGVL